MQRRIILFLAVAALAIGLAACGSSKSSSAGASSGSQITISSNLTFSAASVPAGATVTVKNDDNSSQHTVTADTGNAFNVTVDPGKTVTFTAPSKPGTYKFHCNIHPFMHGTLTVT